MKYIGISFDAKTDSEEEGWIIWKPRQLTNVLSLKTCVKLYQPSFALCMFLFIREVVKTATLEQDPPNHKIVGGVCLHPPCLTSKDGVFIA